MSGQTEQIKWTAVPNGIVGSSIALSIFIAPELSDGPTGLLPDFPDFQDWPGKLVANKGLAWEVNFQNGNGDISRNVFVPLNLSLVSGTLWTTLFTSDVKYGPPEPFQEQYRNIAIASYPAGNITGFLQGQYSNYDPTTVPTLGDVQNTYGAISDVLVGVAAQDRMDRLARERAAGSNGGKRPHANDFSSASMADSFSAQAYYHLAGAGALPQAQLPEIDFHKALTFVGEHYALQRALGLVFDITILIDSIPLSVPSTGVNSDFYVSVDLVNPQGTPPPFGGGPITYARVNPRTHCNASTTVFEAFSNTGTIVNRMLTVNTPAQPTFLAHTIDFDTGGLRAANFATQIHLEQSPASINPAFTARPGAARRAAARAALATPALGPVELTLADILATPTPPPMIRSNGLTLTEVNRGVNLANLLARAFTLFDAVVNQNPVPDLGAEDLVRGYIMDVLDAKDSVWRSTAERVATYAAGPPGSPVLTLTSTTFTPYPFDEASAQAPPRLQNTPSDPNTQQANVSEVILRYDGWSNAAPRPGTPLQDSDAAVGDTDSPFGQKITITVTPAPGRLPPLRFGHTYQMRARAVDICNNHVPVTVGISDATTATDPMVYGRHEAIGSPDIYQQSPARPAESLQRLVIRDVDVAGSGGFPAVSLRALAPQRVQEPFAEWMGEFDDGSGQIQASAYAVIVPAESAQYPDPNPTPSAQGATITLTSPVPYLPDPVARGGALTIFDGLAPPNGLAGVTKTFDFSPTDAWPHYRPFGLQLLPNSAPANAPQQTADVDTTARLITFTLSESDTITMNLFSTCNTGDVTNYGLAVAWGNPTDAATLQAIATGQYWSITPAVELELIYAVQKPLLTPEFPSFPSPARGVGDTFAPLSAQLAYSPKSTSNIDVKASWGDPVDDPVHPAVPVQGPGAPNPALRQTANSPVVTLPTAQSPLPSFGTQDYSATDPWTARQEFYDTKHRNVTYSAVATSQFQEFYPEGTDVTQNTVTPVQVNIPSSARPDGLHIPYIVPSYGWSRTRSGKTTTSVRSPSSLRVFIKRPWWSSGIDELLGVLTWPDAEGHVLTVSPTRIVTFGERHTQRSRRGKGKRRAKRDIAVTGPIVVGAATTPIPADQALFLTDWGSDPVFGSPALPTLHPTMGAFTNATQFGVGLGIEENDNMAVNVAGHPVVFDHSRNLWYCDIAVDTGASYTPMIRLALARFQPNSVSGVELGRIVLADFMSLEPGRTATVVRRDARHLDSVTVTGYSYSTAAGAGGVAPGAAEVIVERRVPGIHDATVGWEQVGDPIGMSPVGRPRFLRIGGGGGNGMTSWTVSDIKLPGGGTHRLVINQYEVLPTDNRQATRGFYFLAQRSREVRLLYQDIIPL